MRETVLLTGGAGFIGSHVAEGYLRQGFRVVALDDFSSGRRDNLPGESENLVIREGDMRDGDMVAELFETYRPSVVNHHAAQKSVPHSMECPEEDLSLNLGGLLTLLMCCKRRPVRKFIHISSGGALSKEITGPDASRETDAPQLMSPYAVTKYAGEAYVALYAGLCGYEYAVLRYSNVYGPRQIPDGECGAVPIFAENLLAGKPSVLMAYDDMPEGCTRDYVNVADVAEANMRATTAGASGVFNIGSGVEISILALYRRMARVFGRAENIERTGPRPGDVRRSVLNCEKAAHLLGWKPSVSLAEGLETLRRWYMER